MTTDSETRLLHELAAPTERLYDRHLAAPRDWYPHEQIDWGAGEDFGVRAWSPEDYPLDEATRSSIYVNLLTEDNLPYYTATLLAHAPADHPLTEWNRRWTMEENRHSMVMRDWVHLSRCLDPTALEDGRRVQMSRGETPQPATLSTLITYVTFQERATQIAHRNTSTRLPKEDAIGRRVLGTIGGDETKHFAFYRDLAAAGYAIDPSIMVIALAAVLPSFAMPGTGIPDFSSHAVRIAAAGIYDLTTFLHDVVEPVLVTWGLDDLVGLSPEAERARENVRASLAALERDLERLGEVVRRRAARLEGRARA